MNQTLMTLSWFRVWALFMAVAAFSGCQSTPREMTSGTPDTIETRPETGPSLGEKAAPTDTMLPASAAEGAVKPAESISGLQNQIASEERRLGAAVESRAFGAVERSSFNLRDLVVALSGKVAGAPHTDAAKLETAVDDVVQSAELLRQGAARRDTAAIGAEYTTLRNRLASLRTLELHE